MNGRRHHVPSEFLPLRHILECGSKADRKRTSVLHTMLTAETNAAVTLRSRLVETWMEGQQSIFEAAKVKQVTELSARRFKDFCAYAASFPLDDEFHIVLFDLEGIYSEIVKISEDNLRVADGRGRRREPGYPDDFLGPTGYIAF